MNFFTKSKIFLFSCLAFIIGIATASLLPENIVQHKFVWFSLVIGFAIFLFFFYQNKKLMLLGLGGLFLFLGIWRYSVSFVVNYPDKIWHYNNQKIILRGVVGEEPDIRLNNQKIKIDVHDVETRHGASLPVGGKLLITADLYPAYNFGDELEIACQLKTPTAIEDFAYDRYLARYDIYSVCYYPKIKKIGEGIVSNSVFDWSHKNIFGLKNKIRETIKLGLSDPESGLALGIMIGDRQGLGDELNRNFSQTGLTHIMAVSGMNMTIIATAVMWLLLTLGLSRRQAFYWSVALIIVFTVLVGAPASAVRAGLMSVLALLALHLGRLNRITNALIFTAVLMLLLNPRLLRDDVGFQLSFLAVLGLIYFYPIFKKYSEKFSGNFGKAIWEIIALTLSAQVFTLPIITYNFKQVSLIAPFSNLLTLWTIPPIMLLVFIAVILSLVFPSLAVFFFAPANLLLKYLISTVHLTARIPFAFVSVEYLWLGWVVVYYVGVGWFLWKRHD